MLLICYWCVIDILLKCYLYVIDILLKYYLYVIGMLLMCYLYGLKVQYIRENMTPCGLTYVTAS